MVLDAYFQLIFMIPSTLILYKKIINCKKMEGWYAKKYANKVGRMHESKGHVLAKPHPYIFFTLHLGSILES